MSPNFLHIQSSYEDAESTLSEWVGRSLDLDDLDVEVESNGWVTLSIDLDHGLTEDWLELAKSFNFLYESYSTSLCMGELVYCRDGQLVRHLLIDDQNPDQRVDIGTLATEASTPLKEWSDVLTFVDDASWTDCV